MLSQMSIKRRLLLPGLSALLALVLSLSAFWANRYADRLYTDFEATVVLSNTFVVPPLVSSVWDYEVELTQTNLSGLASLEPFLFARVYSSGEVFAEKQVAAGLSSEGETVVDDLRAVAEEPGLVRANDMLFVSAPLTRADGRRIGQLIAGYSTQGIKKEINEANLLAAVIGVVAFSAFAVMLYTIAQSVSRPITGLVKRIKALQAGKLDIYVPEATRTDETGLLGAAVVSFQNTLKETKQLEKKRRQAEQDKTESDERLREAEEKRRTAQHEETIARAEREKERMLKEHAAEKAREAERTRLMAEQSTVVEGLQQGLSALARGDLACILDQPFPDQYEGLRKDFNATVSKLNSSVEKSLDKVAAIRSETNSISSAAAGLAARTENQASTVEATSSAVGELTSSAKGASLAAKAARDLAVNTRKKAEEGADVVSETAYAMQQIEERSAQIAKITAVINDLAFQTNLLALNAGVEAARAGEQGHGFAVVAAEVRALAGRSADAAQEIGAIISASSDTVARGSILVEKSREALKVILGSVAEISDKVVDVADKSKSQTDQLEELDSAIRKLDQTTQLNAAMFEETTAAIESVARESNILSDEMSFFSLTGGTVAPTLTPRNGNDGYDTLAPVEFDRKIA